MTVDTSSGRRAFYRGETIELVADDSADTEVSANRRLVRSGDLILGETVGSRLRIETANLRSGQYTFTVESYRDEQLVESGEIQVTVAARPSSDRLTVWLWPHQAFIDTVEKFDETSRLRVDWWGELGLNNFSFELGAHHGADVRQFWDYALTKGWTVCLQPEGGLMDVAIDSADSDLIYKDATGKLLTGDGTAAHPAVANPFHPEVARWQDTQNRKHMEVAVNYPQITTAFFNTEMTDLISRNANAAGEKLIDEHLGFVEGEQGSPLYIQPGVLSEQDRGYRYRRFKYRIGDGLNVANARTDRMIKAYRPDILSIHDPFRIHALMGTFEGIDMVSTWTYVNPDPKLMLSVESLRALSKDAGKEHLSTVTLLNYPGELAPTDRWMMMDAGRLTVATWINLSRAPKMLSYYFSSQCDPFGALQFDLKTKDTQTTDFEIPQSTFDRLRDLSQQVIQPFGPLISRLTVAPRRIAVLNSDTSRLYGQSPILRGYYANTQIFHFYTILAMAQLQADVVLEESIQRWGLDDYDVLVLPKCDVLPESVYEAILKFEARGGVIIADQYLVADIPNAIRFDFDFTYRDKVSAQAIVKNQSYEKWDDQVMKGSDVAFKTTEGVTALDDQKILESYAKVLRDAVDGRIARQVDCLSPTALLTTLESNGVTYLFIINDKRGYGSRLGEYQSVLEQIEPQQIEVLLQSGGVKNSVVYDLLANKELVNENGVVAVNLGEIGGTILALYPAAIHNITLVNPAVVQTGDQAVLGVDILDRTGALVPGAQPLKLELIDANGNASEFSDYYCAENGSLRLPITIARNDAIGSWTIKVTDFTSGLAAEAQLEVR